MPNAATSTLTGSAPGTFTPPCACSVSPSNDTLPVRTTDVRTSRYSRMCRTGFSNERPQMPSTTIWWDRPIPSARRLPLMACTVSACWASVIGWRG